MMNQFDKVNYHWKHKLDTNLELNDLDRAPVLFTLLKLTNQL